MRSSRWLSNWGVLPQVHPAEKVVEPGGHSGSNPQENSADPRVFVDVNDSVAGTHDAAGDSGMTVKEKRWDFASMASKGVKQAFSASFALSEFQEKPAVTRPRLCGK